MQPVVTVAESTLMFLLKLTTSPASAHSHSHHSLSALNRTKLNSYQSLLHNLFTPKLSRHRRMQYLNRYVKQKLCIAFHKLYANRGE